jgi:hypothetical protein
VCAAAALSFLVASCTGSSRDEGPTIPSPAAAPAVWAAAYATGGRVTGAQAAAQAEAFDVIGALPWTYRDDVAQMKAANPDLILLAYMNATFAQRNEGTRYPSSWYLRDANGRQVRSRTFGNYLMDPTDPAWIDDRVDTCRRFLRISHYDGCLLDMLGTAPVHAGYVTAAPIDPSTGQPWTASAWLQATSALAAEVKQGNEHASVVGNGLQNGTRFFDPVAPSSAILGGIDGGIAETWLRDASQPIDRYPDVAAWRASVDMLGSTDKSVFVETKLWTRATPAEIAGWRRFAEASFLLGTEGTSYFAFSESRIGDDVSIIPMPAIGSPVARYERVGDAFERTFTDGMVVVNPTDGATTVDLGSEYRDPTGHPVRSLAVAPHSGAILTLAR